MTKILLLLTFTLCSRGFQPTVAEHFTNSAAIMVPDASDTCYTFTVDNTSPDSLGDVIISGATDYGDFYVTGTGEYQQTLCFTAVSATIAGTVVPYPNSANIQLPSGAKVTAGWQSPSLIEVATETIQDIPLE